ncbi:MAG: DHA2 family efflux MFS transporter permease subunit [Cytophagales bacterium]|nr:DHA2 family efflux MFS transporter permease subunit [Rhizobacter sp.]
MPLNHPHSLATLQERHGRAYRWRVLLTVMLGTMASIMASTIVNVALPDMSRVFTLGQERAQWLSAGFMAAVTVSMLTTPWLLGRFGYRHTYFAAVCLLMVGGVAGGLGSTFEVVLAMRVVEGLAAGVMQPIPPVIVLHIFGRQEQGKAMGIFGFGVVLAPAMGPSIGGVLVEAFGWRSIFFVVVPFCIAALVLARKYLPHSSPGAEEVNQQDRRFDLPGLVVLSVAVLTGMNGLVHLHTPSLYAYGLLAVSAVSSAVFIWRQRTTEHPLMEFKLFDIRAFRMGGVVAFIYGAALFGSTYLVPVFMQIGLHLPPSQAGAVLLPAGIFLAFMLPLGGRLADHYPFNKLVAVGVTLLTLSFWLMALVGLETSLWVITAFAIVGRIGLGLVLPSLNLGAIRRLPMVNISHGSSTINFLRQLGGAVGVSMAGIVLEWRLQVHAAAPLRAFHETFVLLGAICACAIVAGWRMQPPGAGVVRRDAPASEHQATDIS